MSYREIGVCTCVTLKPKRYQQLTCAEHDAVNTELHSWSVPSGSISTTTLEVFMLTPFYR